MSNQTVEEIVKEEIARDIKNTLEAIAHQEYILDLNKERLKELRKQEACDGHEFVCPGGGLEATTEVCSKCGREYYYWE